jgi:hypothetical protein
MNKKEMIEEMKKLCCWFENRKCTANPGIDDICDMSCEYGQACEKLMSEGYRKIPKGSVVLSKEEFDKDYVTKQDRDYWKNKTEILGNRLKEARKETAKEIIKMIEERYGYIGILEDIAKQFEVEE